ncbi:MAG: PPOX class F420-dependent oxidoreductase [Candidatus Thorarchaeota archaeon]
MLSTITKEKYISLTTYRKNGEGVPTPVLFAEENGKLYVETESTRYKVNRIKNNPNVQFAPCNMRGKLLGSSIDGTARILSESEKDIAFEALRKKYFRFRFGDALSRSKSKNSKKAEKVYIEIIPKT